MKTTKIIIAGGRNFKNYSVLEMNCNQILKKYGKLEIVSGGALGVDQLGERYANKNNIVIKRFPANWSLYRRAAGPRRNEEMAIYADVLIAFWDGKSKGTGDMIRKAKKHNLEIHIIKI